jgi:hypothetical protein
LRLLLVAVERVREDFSSMHSTALSGGLRQPDDVDELLFELRVVGQLERLD